ncbi:sensor histidine kinase [Nocardia mangyaensis]|uniref:sensor histidine kinase n=1 Tax=Nocardia mangyaensis TaxID=2213200 RepID=UPI0026776599|nr:histidine kinase [Nocardia mangyaensis]MDO3648893.1 histidine kinase [Nocardia mangyaensis]
MSAPNGIPSHAATGSAARSVNRGSAHPLGAVMLALVAGACVVNGLFLDALPLERQLVFAAVAVLAYLHGRRVPLSRGWPTLLVVSLPALGYCLADFAVGLGALLCLLVFFVLPWLAGRFRRQQAALIAAGQDRVAQLEQEQALIAERVTLRERARIAAEMHDSLGHELALIAVQAGALELSPDLPSTYQAAAQRLRESAVMATDRLRGTVAVLRDPGSAPNLPHGESVTALVDRAEAAGMAVCLKRSEPWKPLPPLIDRAIYRVVQESLTNAARHAPGAPITVALGATPTAAIVTVANPATHSIADDALLRSVALYPAATDPTAPRSPAADEARAVVPTGPGDSRHDLGTDCRAPTSQSGGAAPNTCDSAAGSGLAGLREQARLVGGSLSAGVEESAFVVRAQFPLEEVQR